MFAFLPIRLQRRAMSSAKSRSLSFFYSIHSIPALSFLDVFRIKSMTMPKRSGERTQHYLTPEWISKNSLKTPSTLAAHLHADVVKTFHDVNDFFRESILVNYWKLFLKLIDFNIRHCLVSLLAFGILINQCALNGNVIFLPSLVMVMALDMLNSILV